MSARVFIFGAGYSAQAFAAGIAGEAEIVGGTTRSVQQAETLARKGIRPFLYEGQGFKDDVLDAVRRATHLVVSIAPGEDGDPVLDDLQAAAIDPPPALAWIGYLSTVGVYGDHGGAWVDETAECRPRSPRSRRRLETEQAWRGFARRTQAPLSILRLSGIYGPGRNAFVNLAEGKARRIVKPGQVFNRVYVEDIAGALRHLMRMRADGVYNVTDDEPAPPQDVVAYAAHLMDVAPPPEITFDEADMTPMARSFYSECKRAANGKLKASGYRLRYPDYRQALETMWESGVWKGEAAANLL